MHSLGAFAGVSAERSDPREIRPRVVRSGSARILRPRSLSHDKAIRRYRSEGDDGKPVPSSSDSSPSISPSTSAPSKASLSFDVRAAAARSALRRMSVDEPPAPRGGGNASRDTSNRPLGKGRQGSARAAGTTIGRQRPLSAQIEHSSSSPSSSSSSSPTESETEEFEHKLKYSRRASNGSRESHDSRTHSADGTSDGALQLDESSVLFDDTPALQRQQLRLAAAGYSTQCTPRVHANEDRFVIHMRLHKLAGTEEPVALLAVVSTQQAFQRCLLLLLWGCYCLCVDVFVRAMFRVGRRMVMVVLRHQNLWQATLHRLLQQTGISAVTTARASVNRSSSWTRNCAPQGLRGRVEPAYVAASSHRRTCSLQTWEIVGWFSSTIESGRSPVSR